MSHGDCACCDDIDKAAAVEHALRAQVARLLDLMRRDDQLQDMQRHGVFTPEQMQHAWDVHRKKWEAALVETDGEGT